MTEPQRVSQETKFTPTHNIHKVDFRLVPGETSLMCHHVPGSPAFLMNVEKLGVAWRRGYQQITLTYLPRWNLHSIVQLLQIVSMSEVQYSKDMHAYNIQ